jgi:hypothetical protein
MKMPAGPGGVELATRGAWLGPASPTRLSTGEIVRALSNARRDNFRLPMTSCCLSLVNLLLVIGHCSRTLRAAAP